MEDKTRQSQPYLENILLYTATHVQYLTVHNYIWTRFYCPNIAVTGVSNYSFVYSTYNRLPQPKKPYRILTVAAIFYHNITLFYRPYVK
jgi:hypothetical protein